METPYDHLFSEDPIERQSTYRRVYVDNDGIRYAIDSFSIDENRMKIWLGNSSETVPILPHLPNRQVISLTRKELSVLVSQS